MLQAPEVPRLAPGVELLGEYADSGFKEPPYIARRRDGQMVQLPPMLHVLAEEIDGQSSYEEIGERLSHRVQRGVSGENVRMLVEERLRPLGLVVNPDGSESAAESLDPLLGLRFKKAVIPHRAVRALAATFKPLFHPLVVLAVLGAFAAVDVWFFFVEGVGPGIRSTIYAPAAMLAVLAMVTLAAAFHECGHAAGCTYGGATPGEMGAGIYIVWPAFYTNVTDSYRLGKAGRLRTDLGGAYFNLIFVILTAGVYLATGFEPLLLVMLVQHMEILRHFFPFVRLDGYYVFSDLTGVPDLFPRIKPILRSLRPGGAKREPAVADLKPWVRWVVTGWVVLVLPVIGLNILLLVIHLPRIAATTFDSFAMQRDAFSEAWTAGDAPGIALGALQVVLVLLPPLGVVLMVARIARKVTVGGWRATGDSPGLRLGLATATLALAGLAAFLWWPNGEYRPLQVGERLTIREAVKPVVAIPGGRPALTPEREAELEAAPAPSEEEVEGPAVEPTTTASPSPSATPTGTPTPSPSASASPTASPTASASPTATPTTTPTPTSSPSPSPSPSPTATTLPVPTPTS